MELKEIRRKIGSVSNIWKLTSALETLSALKMKKAQKIALLSSPFAKKIAEILRRLDAVLEEKNSIFLKEREVKKNLVAVITSDRGFCGSFNQNVLRLAEGEIQELKKKEEEIQIFPLGKNGIKFFKKRNYKIDLSFSGIGDFATMEEIKPVSDFLVKSFLEDRFQKIWLIYTGFISTFSLKPKKIQLLPLRKEDLKDFLGKEPAEVRADFLIEPSKEMLVEEITPQLISYLIYQCILESNASEHSARMLAMKNASDNAKAKAGELRLDYNKARQEQITREVCEISSTKEVLE